VCADQVGSVVGAGGSIAQIKRDITGFPDATNSSIIVEGGRPYSCSSYTSSSSNDNYYTRVVIARTGMQGLRGRSQPA
jgi:hypothetical protein